MLRPLALAAAIAAAVADVWEVKYESSMDEVGIIGALYRGQIGAR